MDSLFNFAFTNFLLYVAFLPALVAFLFQVKQKYFILYLNALSIFLYSFVSYLKMDEYNKEEVLSNWPEISISIALIVLAFYSLNSKK
jgi:uncharacterized membrane protein